MPVLKSGGGEFVNLESIGGNGGIVQFDLESGRVFFYRRALVDENGDLFVHAASNRIFARTGEIELTPPQLKVTRELLRGMQISSTYSDMLLIKANEKTVTKMMKKGR